MPVPTQQTNYVTLGQGLLISQYAQQVVVPGLVAVASVEVQTLENAVFSVINGIQLSNNPLGGANWDVLDKLGGLVGQPRNGLSDAQYVPVIKIKIRANRSEGHPNDVIAITSLIAPNPTYTEDYPAGFDFWIGYQSNPNVPEALYTFLGQAKPAGVLLYIYYAPAAAYFIPGHFGSTSYGNGLVDWYSSSFPNTLVDGRSVLGT